ncbi:MAG TPA: DUF1697 domain-containing protein [Vicinamibacterales bacterium]|nr:DUF1697 domain-containing protein [Vicinamibacterales bacterium]
MTRTSSTPSSRLNGAARYIALLRAINVGGHVVKMDQLRRIFESMSLDNVQTFIASGNVIFESGRARPQTLEQTLEKRLQAALGYPVLTFLRTPAEMIAAAAHAPFGETVEEGASIYVAFLKAAPDRAARQKVEALGGDLDAFDVHAREVYWLRRKARERAGEPPPPFDRALGAPVTTRNITTVRKIAAKYCSGDALGGQNPSQSRARKRR